MEEAKNMEKYGACRVKRIQRHFKKQKEEALCQTKEDG